MPVFVRALVLADSTLILAGPPEPAELRKPTLKLEAPEKGEAAFLGRRGAVLWLVSAADGKTLAEYKLESSPVFDGMIAADGQLYMSTVDGKVVCLGE